MKSNEAPCPGPATPSLQSVLQAGYGCRCRRQPGQPLVGSTWEPLVGGRPYTRGHTHTTPSSEASTGPICALSCSSLTLGEFQNRRISCRIGRAPGLLPKASELRPFPPRQGAESPRSEVPALHGDGRPWGGSPAPWAGPAEAPRPGSRCLPSAELLRTATLPSAPPCAPTCQRHGTTADPRATL